MPPHEYFAPTTLEDGYEKIFLQNDCGFSISFKTILMVLLIITMTFSLCGNLFYCIVIYLNKKLHVRSKIMVVNLAITNIVISLTIPVFECMYIYSYPGWPYGHIFNNIQNSFLLFAVVAPFVCSTIISVDRYFAVVKPFQYRVFATSGKFIFFLSMTWIYSILWVVIMTCNFTDTPDNIYTWNVSRMLYNFTLGIHTVIPIVVIPFLYIRIIITVRNSNVNAGLELATNRDITLAKKSAFVISILFILWIPTVALEFLYNLSSTNCTVKQLGSVSVWLLCVNGAVNPIIYSFGNKEITKYLVKVFLICRLVCKTCEEKHECRTANFDIVENKSKQITGTVPNENYDVIAVQSNFKLPSALSEPMSRTIYDSF